MPPPPPPPPKRHTSSIIVAPGTAILVPQKNLPTLFDELRKKYPHAQSELTDEILQQVCRLVT